MSITLNERPSLNLESQRVKYFTITRVIYSKKWNNYLIVTVGQVNLSNTWVLNVHKLKYHKLKYQNPASWVELTESSDKNVKTCNYGALCPISQTASVRKETLRQESLIKRLFLLEDTVTEYRNEKDVAIILQKKNVLQRNRDRQVFKKALQVVRRNDLAKKLEIYTSRSKSS